jgi:ATP-dependent Clp protease ATP-binding subunit ClpA
MFRTMADMGAMRALLEAAERESAAMGEPEPGAEHVVLAALGLPDGTAAAALAEHGVDAAGLRAAIEAVHTSALAGLAVPPPSASAGSVPTGRGLYRSKGSTRDLLDATAQARRRLRSPRFVSAHVLVGACEFEQGTLASALAQLGVTRDALRSTAQRHLPAPR